MSGKRQFTTDELRADVKFLLRMAAGININPTCVTALLLFAYGGLAPVKSQYPIIKRDLDECMQLIDSLPAHRVTAEVLALVEEYGRHVRGGGYGR